MNQRKDQTLLNSQKTLHILLISPYRSVTYYSRQTSHLEVKKNEQHPDYQRREKIRPLNGQLNDTLTEVADGTLRDLGHDVHIVRADSDYDVKAEVQNFLWADVVIWQMLAGGWARRGR